MTRRSLGELGRMLAILLPGGIAAAIVARVLALYWRRDWPATAIVVAIAGTLGLGLLQLIAQQLRIRRLERELLALPATPREATLDAASPQLSALLRARLEHAPGSPLTDSIAPFLSGLLVMLGLLGTLLGLFQTVHGAGQALTASTDVDALRDALRAPIDGLTRSFGCSAAGISASAMLGLAIALVRRREARLLRAVHAYAAGPLRGLSHDVRQTRVLEQLASQGSSLPAAVSAIERVADKFGELSGQLLAQQQTALTVQRRSLHELLTSVHDEFAKAAIGTGQAMHAHVAPLLEQLAARSGDALAAQSTALADVAREVTQEIERDAKQRRDETARTLEAMRARFDVAESARTAGHARELEALTDLHARTLTDSERRWQDLVARFDLQLEAARASDAERLRSLDAHALAARERDRDHDERAQSAAAQLSAAGGAIEHLPQLLQTAVEQSVGASQHVLTQLVELTEQRMGRVSQLLSDELEQRNARAGELDQRAGHALERVDRSAQLFDGAIAQQSRGLEALLARVGALLPELIEAAQSGAVETLARLRELGEQQATHLTQLESKLGDERQIHARGLADQLTNHADELELRLGKTSDAVHEASAIWQASSAEMQAIVQLFASSVERQREASEAWLESLGDIESAVERAGRHAASDALSDQLASTQELFARQLQFQRELLEQLRALRGGTGARFSNGELDVSARE
ncbi:MAG TPA: hypothetical protein VFG30_11040 [Polyangiales bacterium]|nr:hypothetical protein [Polyangiales bacterium]